MPTLKIACTDQQDTDIKADLCPDERHRFDKWCNRVELWALALPAPDLAVIVARGRPLRHWFDHFNNGLTAREAIDAEVMA